MFVNKRIAVRLALAVGVLAVVGVVTSGIGKAQARQANRSADARIAELEATVKTLTNRITTQEDIEAIYRLTRAYGYYVDKQQWTDVAALWAEKDSSVEIAHRGIYLGRAGAERLFKASMGGGQDGLRYNSMFNHMLLQGVVNVDPGGKTANGRWRAWVQIGSAPVDGKDGMATWSEGTYENEYIKENGVWLFKKMRFWPTFYAPVDGGWGKRVNRNNGPDMRAGRAPDLPRTEDGSDVLPNVFTPPFHYPNPVTGKAWVPPPPRTAAPAGPAGGPGRGAAPPTAPPAPPPAR